MSGPASEVPLDAQEQKRRFVEIIRVLVVLRRRAPWVALGLVLAVLLGLSSAYKVNVFPPRLDSDDAISYGAATTQVLVDSSESTLGNAERTVEPLLTRANIYARLVTSPTLLEYVADASKIPVSAIEAEGPYEPTRQGAAGTPPELSPEEIDRSKGFRLRLDAEAGIPVINVYTTAPTAKGAEALANGAARGLRRYVADLGQEVADAPESAQMEVRQLGRATSGMVTTGAETDIPYMLVALVFGAWLGVIVFVSNAIDEYRRSQGDSNDGGDGDETTPIDPFDHDDALAPNGHVSEGEVPHEHVVRAPGV